MMSSSLIRPALSQAPAMIRPMNVPPAVRAYRVTLALDMTDPRDRVLHERMFGVALDMLTEIDAAYLRAHPEVPPLDSLLRSGKVRYVPEPPGQEEWQDIAITLKRGAGDAEDLACWRAAEEWIRTGRPRRPVVQGGIPEEMRSGRITLVLDLFQGERERPLSRRALQTMLDALYRIDVLYLQAHPETPSLYTTGVRYMEEPIGQEEWQDIPTCLRMGIADCEDLASWRAAELTVKQGIPARPIFHEHRRPNGSYLYHILTKYPDGRIEDPSQITGMR